MNAMTLPLRTAVGETGEVELSIVMPCLNEAETLGLCIEKANRFLVNSGVRGEVVIADNGSTDGSQAIAESLGARVVPVPVRGYGAALLAGSAREVVGVAAAPAAVEPAARASAGRRGRPAAPPASGSQ